MDGNNHSNNGFFHRFPNHSLGQALGDLVRGILPQHPHPQQPPGSSSQDSSTRDQPAAVSPPGLRVPTLNAESLDANVPTSSRMTVQGTSVSQLHVCSPVTF